jgi:hypothetical protein
MIESGELTASAARELARLKDQALQRETAHAIAEGRLNARQIERTVRAVQLAHEPDSASDGPSLATYGEPVDVGPIMAAADALEAAIASLSLGLDAGSQVQVRQRLTRLVATLQPWLAPTPVEALPEFVANAPEPVMARQPRQARGSRPRSA